MYLPRLISHTNKSKVEVCSSICQIWQKCVSWKTRVHGRARAHNSDWYKNSFIMVVYENIFLKLSQNFLSKARLKKFSRLKKILIDNHYKTIFVSVRMACSSPTEVWLSFCLFLNTITFSFSSVCAFFSSWTLLLFVELGKNEHKTRDPINKATTRVTNQTYSHWCHVTWWIQSVLACHHSLG